MRARPIILNRENTCYSTPGAHSYHSYCTVSCFNSHSWETSCRCGPIQSSWTEKTLVSPLRVHAVTAATAGFPVAIVTVGKPLADAARLIILHRENKFICQHFYTIVHRWNSWMDIFLLRFLGINSSLLRVEFLSAFVLSFCLSTKFYSWIDLSFVVSRFFMHFKNQSRVRFSVESGTVNSMEQKTRVFCQIMFNNSVSDGILVFRIYTKKSARQENSRLFMTFIL